MKLSGMSWAFWLSCILWAFVFFSVKLMTFSSMSSTYDYTKNFSKNLKIEQNIAQL